MANRRMISKSISTSTKLSGVSDFAALLFTWLQPHCDDNGNMDANPIVVRGLVVPMRKQTVEEVEAAMTELEEVKLITRYSIDGTKYLHVEKFEKHQTLRGDRIDIRYPENISATGGKPDGNQPATGGKRNLTKHNLTERNLTPRGGGGETQPLPGWLNKRKWQEWLDYRKERRLTRTPATIKRQLKFLEVNKADHEAIIEQSIANGWQGLFPSRNRPARSNLLRPPAGKYDNVKTTKI
ncbi:MAG: hypothetical protein PHI63_06860 [Patescibacteria group bacterium]|nr:hypothetical protein [Patescibacteria group bacterium]